MRNSSHQRGFTLIELIVVIVILGILASFAVPKFMGVEREARVAAVNAMAGTLRSAAAMAHGVQTAQGLAANASITVEGTSIAMASTYPTRVNLNALVQDATGFAYTANNGRFTRNGSSNANCYTQYNNATQQTVVVNGQNQLQMIAPVVTTVTTGC